MEVNDGRLECLNSAVAVASISLDILLLWIFCFILLFYLSWLSGFVREIDGSCLPLCHTHTHMHTYSFISNLFFKPEQWYDLVLSTGQVKTDTNICYFQSFERRLQSSCKQAGTKPWMNHCVILIMFISSSHFCQCMCYVHAPIWWHWSWLIYICVPLKEICFSIMFLWPSNHHYDS